MIRSKHVQDRLYLSQSDEETIYIDNCKIPQHHIEGIRFLYRQFKRKTNGVIINDPYGFGRNIQIILFLKAIRLLLRKPVLILCEEGSEQDWVDRFYTWTDLTDEVAVETTNPFLIKKAVIINTMVNLHRFCAREWSIVVVDGAKVTTLDPIVKLPFKSEFKIWNTPIHMKENLDKFGEIYEWMFPSKRFDKSYFIADPENAVDVIEKSILLDSFLEDIVIRREDLNSSFEQYQRSSDVVMPSPKAVTITAVPPTATATTATSTATVVPATITKKNKDATGTKIKRSKTRTDAENVLKPFEPPTADLTKLIEESPKACETFDSREDFSIQNYKRKLSEDKEDIKEGKESPYEIIELDNMSNQSDMKLFYEPDSEAKTTAGKLEEMDTLVFGTDTLISKVTDYKYETENSTASNKKDTEPQTILTCKPIGERHTHKNIATTENKKQSSGDTTRPSAEGSRSSDCAERDKKNDIESLPPNNSKLSTDEPKSDITKMNIDELNRGIRELGTRDYSEKIAKRQKITDTSTAGESVNCHDDIVVTPNERNEQTSDKGTNVTEQIANRLKRNNVDDKKKECQEKLSKKFKGSFLDSLF